MGWRRRLHSNLRVHNLLIISGDIKEIIMITTFMQSQKFDRITMVREVKICVQWI